MRPSLFPAAAVLVLLGACQARGEEDEASANASQPISAEGKAEEGKISIKAPGFDLTFNLPKEMSQAAKVDKDSKILYPGATIAGVALAAGKGGKDADQSEVEMRFRTADPVDRVAAWYRDPARSAGFRLQSVAKDGDAVVIAGIQNSDRHPFKVRLAPQPNGGTDGRLTIHHSD
ncbi:MAG: hypothetical protein QOH04_750 [Sphingomonadales bacterium]|jgi:hypothetical protein|nr:hypothetical protein [Sphingomonadales bacterium]